MFVYRGEKLKETDYVINSRKEHRIYLDETIEYYSERINEARLKEEKILLDKDGKLKVYQAYTKPVEELTDTEKRIIIDTYNSMNSIFSKTVQMKNPTDVELKFMQSAIALVIENPLDSVRKDIDFYNRMIHEAKEQYSRYFAIALDRENINRENIDVILEHIRKAKENGLECRVGIDGQMAVKKNDSGVDYMYSKEEMNLLLEVDNTLKNNGYKGLVFSELNRLESPEKFDESWTLEQVVNANNKIDQVANHILNNNLSPFEAMIYIHKIASNFVYKENLGLEETRVLPSVLNSTDIVCAGYASLVKAIVDRIDLPGLKCEIKGCAIGVGKDVGGHCHNLVTITDEKYGIDGTYLEDACWDSRLEGQKIPRGVAHCLYPVSDVMHFNNGVKYFDNTDETRLSNLIVNPNDFKDAMLLVNGNLLQRALAKISMMLKRKGIPNVVKQYGEASEPIDIEKYKEALRVVYKTKYDDDKIVEEKVMENINNSIKVGAETFNEDSLNVFANELDERQRKKVSKSTKGPSSRI